MKTEIKYKTAGGNTVTWKRDPDDERKSDPWGSFECGGCGETHRTYLSLADKHARNCRAL